MTKEFTHTKRLAVSKKELAEWLETVRELDLKFGALLVQLPPSLSCEPKIAHESRKNGARFFF